MIRHGFDFRFKIVTLVVQFLSTKSGAEVSRVDVFNCDHCGNKALLQEAAQKLREPVVQQVFPALGLHGLFPLLASVDTLRADHEREERETGTAEEFARSIGLDLDAQVGGVLDLAEQRLSHNVSKCPRATRGPLYKRGLW